MLATFSYLYCANFKDMTNIERFFQKVYPEPNTGCWLWGGSLNTSGYGNILKRTYGYSIAHRFSYFLHYGEFNSNLHVLHICDTPCCVNPNHLFLGTNNDNVRDRYNKGRSARGETHHKSKITNDDVLEIRKLFASGKFLKAQLALLYGLTSQSITGIVNRKTWRHV